MRRVGSLLVALGICLLVAGVWLAALSPVRVAAQTSDAKAAPIVTKFGATLVVPVTTYAVEARDPEGKTLTYRWKMTGEQCGTPKVPWEQQGPVARWSHSNAAPDNCTHSGTDHNVDVTLTITAANGAAVECKMHGTETFLPPTPPCTAVTSSATGTTDQAQGGGFPYGAAAIGLGALAVAGGVVVWRTGLFTQQRESVPDAGDAILEGFAGMSQSTVTQDHPHTVARDPGVSGPEQLTAGPRTPVAPLQPEEGGRYTVEMMQADRWEAWNGVYNPQGEYSFVQGARIDLANPDYDDDTKQIRMWIIAIYVDAYKDARSRGIDHDVAHAMARIRVDEWRQASLDQFVEAFGTHFMNLGMAISGDALGNVQRLVAEGVAVEAPRIIATVDRIAGETETVAGEAETVAGTTETVAGTVETTTQVTTEATSATTEATTTAAQTFRPTAAPPINRVYLLANDTKGIAQALKIKPKPGFFDVFCHGETNGFSLKINGEWFEVGPETLVDAMKRSGYEGGPVRLIACDTGGSAEGAAQKVADLLGETVEAPTGKVWATASGGTFVGQAEHINGQWVVTGPGGWNTFFPTLPATPLP